MADNFAIDAEILYGFVADKEEGLRLLREHGGAEAVARDLHSSTRDGRRDSEEAETKRRKVFGENKLPPPEEVTFLDMLKEALGDQMMLLLIASAVVSLILGLTVADPHTGKVDYEHGWIEGTAILVSVLIVSFVSATNNYQKELKFRELSAAAPPDKFNIVRKGIKTEVLSDTLLVGDLLFIQGGDIVPCDGIVVKSTGLKMDESASTGENDDIEKSASGDCVLRSGTNVLEGEAYALVIAVGQKAMAGRIAMSVREEKAETPLQEKLTHLAENIGKMGTYAAVAMFIALTIKELYAVYVLESRPLVLKKFLDMITNSVTIVVVAVPEGLPLSVTIALAYSMKQMMKENNLVRHLAACETMGGATSICTDKTGTLTMNEMTVTNGTLCTGIQFELTGDKGKDKDVVETQIMARTSKECQKLIGEGISANSTAVKITVQATATTPAHLKWHGNKTEQAMLAWVERLGVDPTALRKTIAPDDLKRYPFTSAKKSMTTVVRHAPGHLFYHVKGASEIVLEHCRFVHNGNSVEPITPEMRSAYKDSIVHMAKNRLRTLAIAYTEVRGKSEFDEKEREWPPLTLLGVLGVEDPIRPEVEGAVSQCKKAGVAVRMVTGDNKTTAMSIAKKAGIYGTVYWGDMKGEAGIAMEGRLFRELAKSEQKLNVILPRLQVLARASPLDKQILVSSLMKRSEVVAVTGDGTNDAPALKNANVGFAMNSGTDVAKKASDVVILDDNFCSIVTAMKWGRNVNDNICKFIQFQTTVNVAAVFISFVGAITSGSGESPLKPVQLLWLNLIMDTMAALALATEPPTDALLERAPKARETPLVSRRMWINILGQAMYQIIVQLWLLNGGHEWFGVEAHTTKHLTIIFNVFVLMQVTNEFNARILGMELNVFRGLADAHMFMAIIVITSVVQVLGVTYFGSFMKTVPLNVEEWKKCALLSLAPLPIGVLLRSIHVTEEVVPLYREFIDKDEEEREKERLASRPRITLEEAARRVIAQLKIVGAFSSNLKK